MTSIFNTLAFNSSEACAISTCMKITNKVSTVKGWISECEEKRAGEELVLRTKYTMLRRVPLAGILFLYS
jgi:hypothetical protein